MTLSKKTKELIKKISELTGLNEKIIEEKVKNKLKEYDYFISEEAAVKIVAKDLGVLDKIEEKKLEGIVKIRDLKPGLKGIKIRGKVLEISDEKISSKGSKYRYILLTDDTSIVKVYFWENKLKDLDNLEIGNIVELYVDVLEGKFGTICKYKHGLNILGKEEVKEERKEKIEWKYIRLLKDEERVLIKGVIVNKLSRGYIINDLSGEVIVRTDDFKYSIGDLVYVIGVYSKKSNTLIAEKIGKIDDLDKEINFLILKIKDELNRGDKS